MKNFDAKWQQLTERALQAAPREDAAPFGFATRVLARVRDVAQPSGEELWGRLALRLLGVVLPLLFLCIILEAPHLRGGPCLQAGVENAVAQILWRL